MNTCAAAYENAHLVARDLVERIRVLLDARTLQPGDENAVYWGHVGDLTHVTALLSPVVAFLERD